MGVSQNHGYLFGGPYNKEYSILGSILGFPYLEKLPDEPRLLKHPEEGLYTFCIIVHIWIMI